MNLSLTPAEFAIIDAAVEGTRKTEENAAALESLEKKLVLAKKLQTYIDAAAEVAPISCAYTGRVIEDIPLHEPFFGIPYQPGKWDADTLLLGRIARQENPLLLTWEEKEGICRTYGSPGYGKSTLFESLTRQAQEQANDKATVAALEKTLGISIAPTLPPRPSLNDLERIYWENLFIYGQPIKPDPWPPKPVDPYAAHLKLLTVPMEVIMDTRKDSVKKTMTITLSFKPAVAKLHG